MSNYETEITLWQDTDSRDLWKLSKLRQKTWDQVKKSDSPDQGRSMPLKLQLAGKPFLQNSARRRSCSLWGKMVGGEIHEQKHFSATSRCSNGAEGSWVPGGLHWQVLPGYISFEKSPKALQWNWTWSSSTNTHKGRIWPCAIKLLRPCKLGKCRLRETSLES